jgi:sugar lactone lactonase YvrE
MGALVLGLGSSLQLGCADDASTGTGGSTSTGTSTSGTTTATTGSATTGSTTSSASGTGGAGGGACTATAPGAVRGDAIAISPDDATLVVANRDAGTVSVLSVDWTGGVPTPTKKAELAVGSEPWQVAIDACGKKAYVVVREDQKLVEIDDLDTTPAVGPSVAVGSEPTAVAISPNGTRIYVANWVDGTLMAFDDALAPKETLDLNASLAATGLLGAVTSRPALAHPRSIAITNNGDASDADEKVVVTEFFAQRTAPDLADGSNADTSWEGLLYVASVGQTSAQTLHLAPIADAGVVTGAGCFPNQLQSVTLAGRRAFVTSVCASPRGPLDVKAMTYPVVHAIDVDTGAPTTAGPLSLAKEVASFYDAHALPDDESRRNPLLANDLAFGSDGAAYVTANGADAVFRFDLDATTGAVTTVGAGSKAFVDLGDGAIADAAKRGENPVGLAAAHAHDFAFVSSDVSRNVTPVSLGATGLEIAGGVASPHVTQASDLPTDAPSLSRLAGKRAFETGLGRFSLKGQAWGACQSCHFEGLSDGVTWYFGRGQRQSTSLDGSFASNDPTDQRVFNWTGVFDEIADFEGVARSIDGGVGALVSVANDPATNADRLDLTSVALAPPAGASGLNGSAETLMQQSSALDTRDDVRAFVARVRSPRAPTNLDPAAVAAGKTLFESAGKCQGCHGDAKWTVSRLFYAPSGATNAALKTKSWDGAALVAAGFPAALLPATVAQNQVMRFSAAGGDQIQCVLRDVGTYGVGPAAVGVNEKRADGTAGQGNLEGGLGFNVPSLLGLQVGAPYFHAGNARTLEELLSTTFQAHTEALTQGADPVSTQANVDALVAYLLSIDESTPPLASPTTPGADGGGFCAAP